MKIGIVIRDARIKSGYSQDGLAYLAKMNRQYISKIERECCVPQLEQLVRIALALGVTASSLVSQAEQIESLMIPLNALSQEQMME